VRLLTEYEITKILNRAEINYAKDVKGSDGDGRKYNLYAVYTVREIRKKIESYLNKKYEK